MEVEAIGKVRHKNLVGLLGYCAESAKRYSTVSPTFYFLRYMFGVEFEILLFNPCS